MYGYPISRERSLQSGTGVYNSPLLLAGALEKLERLADKRRADTSKTMRAGPGCVVDLLDLKDNNQVSFELVLPKKADPKNGRISVLSPLGSSLLGLQSGDFCRVYLWGHSHNFEILDIRVTDTATAEKEEMPS